MRSADLDVRKREPETPPATPHPHGVIGVDGLEGPGRSRPADAQQFQRLRPHHSSKERENSRNACNHLSRGEACTVVEIYRTYEALSAAESHAAEAHSRNKVLRHVAVLTSCTAMHGLFRAGSSYSPTIPADAVKVLRQCFTPKQPP